LLHAQKRARYASIINIHAHAASEVPDDPPDTAKLEPKKAE
jgi:hypothetical protein